MPAPPAHPIERALNAARLAARCSAVCLVLAAVALLAGCGDRGGAAASGEIYRDPSQSIEARVADLLSRMTLEEKIEQMHGVSLPDSRGLNPTAINERLGIANFEMVDGARGVSAATGAATTFPVGSARGATFAPDLEVEVGRAIGSETRAKGGNVILAPVINLLRHPRWGRAQETYGEDTFHLGTMGAGFIQGAQEHVIANAKHFALNSIEDDRFTVDVHVDERTLREVYLAHFKRAVDAGVGSIMCSYNMVNGSYACENTHLLHDILQGEWGFDGFVESDWVLGTRSTVPSALAGLDIEMPTGHYFAEPLVDAVNGGAVPLPVINDAVKRILRAKFRFGIFDGKPPLDPATTVESPEHTALAREVEEKAIVLLKNDQAALPLVRDQVHRVAVVGVLAATPNLGDTGSSLAVPSYTITPLDGLQSHAGPVEIVDLSHDTLSAADQAQVAAADAAVVVVGLTHVDEGEGLVAAGDRKTLDLSAGQQQLILDVAKQNPRTIVVLEGSGAILMENWVDQVSAVVMSWYPGMEGGNAIAEVLFGDVDPSGKLPVTFPRSADQLPPFVNDQNDVTYGYYSGYRYLDKNGFDPRYPFGFGLSYTTFSFQNLTLARSTIAPGGTLHATVDVSNTGTQGGDEVVELYVGYQGSRVDRAVRDLKAFQRVSLGPGETRTVALDVAAADLAFWDVDTNAFVVEPITYTVEVGSSSRDLPLGATFSISPP